MKLCKLLGKGKTDVARTTSSSLVTYQDLWPPMLPKSPATPGAMLVPILHVHALSQFGAM
jgi:hypothetical protein